MQYMYDLQHGTVLIRGDGTVEIQYKGQPDPHSLCVEIAQKLVSVTSLVSYSNRPLWYTGEQKPEIED